MLMLLVVMAKVNLLEIDMQFCCFVFSFLGVFLVFFLIPTEHLTDGVIFIFLTIQTTISWY